MYARLWWKDARQFWAIWVFLAAAMAVIQALAVHYLGEDARHGSLGYLALTCACLYAFATGAAAFAGERETGTLTLLDSLAIDRNVIWTAKSTFALATTLMLTFLLFSIAAFSTNEWKQLGSFVSPWDAVGFAMMIPVALGWGLLWSAVLSNALTAAVTAISATGLSLGLLAAGFERRLLDPARSGPQVCWQLFLFLATAIASAIIFAHRNALGAFRAQLPLTASTQPRRPGAPNARSASAFVAGNGGSFTANPKPNVRYARDRPERLAFLDFRGPSARLAHDEAGPGYVGIAHGDRTACACPDLF